jgi:hypothetical protein
MTQLATQDPAAIGTWALEEIERKDQDQQQVAAVQAKSVAEIGQWALEQIERKPFAQEAQALERTRQDQLFQQAREAEIATGETTQAPLRRFNQIRRELGLPPDARELPPELIADTSDRAANAAKQALRGFAETANRAVEGIGDLADALSELVGVDFEPPSDFFEASRNVIRAFLPDDPRLRQEFFASQLPHGLGSTLTFAALGASGGVPGVIGAGVGVGAQEQAERAREVGAPERDKAVATLLGGALGTTETALPLRLFKVLKPVNRAVQGKLFNAILTRGGLPADVAVEASQELGQQLGSNIIARTVLKQDQPLMEGLQQSAQVGGGVGAIMGGLARLAGIRLRRFKSPEAERGAEQSAQARVQRTEQTPAARMVRERPEAAQRLIAAADKAVEAKGPRGVPSKTDFDAEGLTELKNRDERREFIQALREETSRAQEVRGDQGSIRERGEAARRGEDAGREDIRGREEARGAPREAEAREREKKAAPKAAEKEARKAVKVSKTVRSFFRNATARDALEEIKALSSVADKTLAELTSAEIEAAQAGAESLFLSASPGRSTVGESLSDALVAEEERRRPKPEVAKAKASPEVRKAVKAEVAKRTPLKETSGPTLSDKAKQARTEAGKAIDQLGEHLSSTTFANPLADPKTIKLVGNAISKSVKAGVYTFADFVQSLARSIGESRTLRLGPLLVQEWNARRAKNPNMDSAGDVNAILKLGDRVAPTGRAPGLTELPKVDEANDAKPLDLLDQWFADRDEAITEAEIHTGQLQEQLKKIAGTKTYGRKARELDQAIFLYIDLKGKAGQFEKWQGKLSDEQKRAYQRSQNLSPAQLKLANRIRAENRLFGRRAKEADVIGSYLENYTARLWESPEEQKKTLLRRFQVTTGRARPRTLESTLHGWALGKTLRITGATNAQLVARTEIAKVIHDRNLIQLGAKAGLLDDTQHRGWKKVEHPNFRKWIWVGKVEEGKVYGREVYLSPEGDVFRRAELYAEPSLAKKLNNALSRSALEGIRIVDWVTKWNAIAKHTILMTALFHHQAYLRSSMLGSRSMRGVKSYQMGKQAIANYTQVVRDLVRGGLTIGRVQDWEEDYLHQRIAIGRVLDRTPMARDVRDKLIEQRDRQTNFLFRKMGPYYKVQAAILEYRHLLKKHAKDIESGKRTRHYYARIAASLMNDDFGGLHLGRMGRNPTVQHLFRLLALAPDWTESNVRSMVRAFKRGDEGAVYRALWGRVLLRGLGATILFNLILAGFDFDEFWKRHQRAWKQGNLRWLDIDVTPLYRALFGGTNEKRKWFSLIGHFRDPLKFIVHPFRSAKHKGSVLSRFVSDAVTGTDWAGRPFTTFAELVGLDDKEEYKTTAKGKYVKGESKGGKLKGAVVRRQRGAPRPLEYGQIPSFVIAEARATLPIPIQNGIAWFAGELDGFDALTKSLGLMTSTTFPPSSPEVSIKRAFENKDAEAGQAALDRLVQEAKAGATGTAIVKPRLQYIGRLAYGATNKADVNELSRDLLPFLDISYREARLGFTVYWKSRGYSTRSDAYKDRCRHLASLYLRGTRQ